MWHICWLPGGWHTCATMFCFVLKVLPCWLWGFEIWHHLRLFFKQEIPWALLTSIRHRTHPKERHMASDVRPRTCSHIRTPWISNSLATCLPSPGSFGKNWGWGLWTWFSERALTWHVEGFMPIPSTAKMKKFLCLAHFRTMECILGRRILSLPTTPLLSPWLTMQMSWNRS